MKKISDNYYSIKNLRSEWVDLHKACSQREISGLTIDVSMRAEKAKDEACRDAMTLRHMIPLAVGLYRTGMLTKSHPLNLRVEVAGTPGWGNEEEIAEEDDAKRVFVLLLCTENISFIKVFINKEPIDKIQGNRHIKKLFPLYLVSRENEDASIEKYIFLRQPYEDNKNVRFYQIVAEMKSQIVNQQLYRGTKGSGISKISADEKERLSNEVKSEVDKWQKSMDVLSFSIWMILIRRILDDRSLFIILNNKISINDNLLSKSRFDAVSYGEAMYQLIENACEHSGGQMACFGFRIHEAGLNEEGNARRKERRNRAYLEDRFGNCEKEYQIFSKDGRVFFEFYVIDSTDAGVGMIEKYNRDHRAGWQEIKDIKSLFYIQPREEKENYIEDLTFHYGLRLLRKIVRVNRGHLRCSTAHHNGRKCYYCDEVQEIVDNEPTYETEWDVLIPIDHQKEIIEDCDTSVINTTLFGRTAFKELPRVQKICMDNLTVEYKLNYNKIEDIEIYKKILQAQMVDGEKKNSIFVIEPEPNLYRLELFAKAVFYVIAKKYYRNECSDEFLLAIVFSEIDIAYEFVRMYTVVYFEGIQTVMEHVQIAICTKQYTGSFDISMFLGGKYLETSLSIAHFYMYHYLSRSIKYLPLVEYLVDDGRERFEDDKCVEEQLSVYPFDLLLSEEIMETDVDEYTIDSLWDNNLFLSRIRHSLTTNIWDDDFGCRIEGVHVRHGSKLHTDKFYEAEMLFHDPGNVFNFAYILANDILKGVDTWNKEDVVVLLGYERYSASLIYQLEDCLSHNEKSINIVTYIVYDERKNYEQKVTIHPLTDLHYESLAGKRARVITILPVGTTMSTIYKMHNMFSSKVASYNIKGEKKIEKINYYKNYCLILVADNRNIISHLRKKYHKTIDIEHKIIELCDETGKNNNVSVHYLLQAEAQWNSPEKCMLCKLEEGNISPIIDLKNAGLFPGAIFLKDGNRKGIFCELFEEETKRDKEIKENRKRMAKLFSHITYAHIAKKNHHFQFFIHFREFYHMNRNKIKQVLRDVVIDKKAFHVVISPLDIQNAEFVQDVIDQVFCGSAHFLHFNIADAYREEIRSKYSYITQEYITAKKYHPTLRFCVHYLDNSIMSGVQINRARTFAQMLLTQSGISTEDMYIFDRIFLLVSRSSYDTLHSYVREPRRDLWAYIKLAIPCYNTETEHCPACDNIEKYSRLEKRSSSEELSREFYRLVQKHRSYSYEKYTKIVERELIDNPVYFGLLRQWIAVYYTKEKKSFGIIDNEIAEYYQSMGKEKAKEREHKDWETATKLKKSIEKYCSDICDGKCNDKTEPNKILKRLSHTTIREVLSYDSQNIGITIYDVVEFMRIYILGVRDYMRMYSLQMAYEQLDNIEHNDSDIESIILSLVNERTKELLDKEGKLKVRTEDRRIQTVVSNIEWLISYIKVMSRAHFANYYVVRKAIMNMMYSLFLWIQMDIDELWERRKELIGQDKRWGKIIDTIIVLRSIYSHDSTKEKENELNDISFTRNEGVANSRENQVFALKIYQLWSLLFHRLANLQIRKIAEQLYIDEFVKMYITGKEEVFSGSTYLYINYPDMQSALKHFVRSVKIATMTSNDDTPCMELIEVGTLDYDRLQESENGICNMKQQIAEMLFLENTRMLYSGMGDLEKMLQRSGYYQDEQYRLAENYNVSIEKLSAKVRDILSDCYNNGEIRYQNILCNFCNFWEGSYNENVKEDNAVMKITYMLRLYQDLKGLSDSKQGYCEDDMPYVYEDICRTICGISGYNMCYIVLDEVGQIPIKLASSGYYYKYLIEDRILELDDYKKVIFEFMNLSKNNLPSNVRVINDEKGLNLFAIKFMDNLSREKSRSFYLILQSDDELKSLQEQWKYTRNILSMRQSMVEALHRDFADLASKRYDCTYIRTRNAGDTGLSVIHISDLHIDSDYPWKKDKYLSAMQSVKQINENRNIDLLMISGDIVDGRQGSAPVMTERYQYAKDFLNRFIIKLWKGDDGYLPHDWKRRIIISTGNHDYASMNQYRSSMENRDLGPGLPIESDSPTISKFAYYIDFLRDYLDAPVFDWIQNDLNEVRDYRNLNVKLLVLNCSSKATPRRTNKMGINLEKVKPLLQAPCWQEASEKIASNLRSKENIFRICLAHYSPKYNLSYFLDKSIRAIPGWEWGDSNGPMNQLVEKYFAEAVEAEASCRYCPENNKLRSDMENELNLEEKRIAFRDQWIGLKNALKDLNAGKVRNSTDEISDRYFKLFETKYTKDKSLLKEQMEKNSLYKDMKKYNTWLERGHIDENDEMINGIFKQVLDDLRMGRADKEAFKNAMKIIDDCGGEIQLYLAGHIHAYKKETDSDKPWKKVLVASKTFDGNLEKEEMAGYMIHLSYIESDGELVPDINEERFEKDTSFEFEINN